MYIPTRRLRVQRRRIALKALRIFRLALITLIIWVGITNLVGGFTVTIQSPIKVEKIEEVLPNQLPEPTATPIATHGAQLRIKTTTLAKEPEPVREIRGEASYYSREGCLGCSENMTMANGQPLDDSALTLALTPEMVNQYKLLNDIVTVQNVKTGKTVKARVTDTGGFGKYDRVADLSVATRDAINCKNLCEVLITY